MLCIIDEANEGKLYTNHIINKYMTLNIYLIFVLCVFHDVLFTIWPVTLEEMQKKYGLGLCQKLFLRYNTISQSHLQSENIWSFSLICVGKDSNDGLNMSLWRKTSIF